ncbi:hypothetical protein [Streptomyces lutosisoli]|uniref:Uncharacterized protein n=1 Tax=Streptomyces lutosisoli TaxID=2665721 RepID=A0ABW2VC47_9ACTN
MSDRPTEHPTPVEAPAGVAVTDAPDPAEAGAVAEAPEPVETWAVTEAPDPTETAQPTETTKPTDAPERLEGVDAPEAWEAWEAFEAPEPPEASDAATPTPADENEAPDPVTAEEGDTDLAPLGKENAVEPGSEPAASTGDPAGDTSDMTEETAQQLKAVEKDGRKIVEPHGIALDYTTEPVSPECAGKFNEAMRELSADYPKLFDEMNHVRTEQPEDPSILAYALPYAGYPDSGIYVNSEAFSDAEAAALRGAEEEASGFTVPGGGSPKGVFYHEFGHHCAQRIFDSPSARQELDEAVSQSIARPYDSSAPHDKPTGQAISQLLSDYGSTTPHEMMAEAFTEHKLAAAPRPFASAIGGVIDKYLKGK